jgi:hypothetical protein
MTALLGSRRGWLGAAMALAAGARPLAAATSVPESATLMAPGPEEGPAAGFATQAANGLSRALVQAAALRVNVLGGPDGITAANRFATSTPADGRLLLTLPGPAGQALLVGDSRARYEPRHWPALAASLLPALAAGRGPLAETGPLRIALPGPAAPEAALLLVLELLGRSVTPVFLSAGMSPEAAVTAGAADALVLVGRAVPARAASLGLTPWFAFDGRGGARDPLLPGIPALGEVAAGTSRPELLAAARAGGAALRLRGALVLPQLTSADAVALWRAAARRWTDADSEPGEFASRRVSAEEAGEVLATLCPAAEAAPAYRDWLRRRLGFQAG